MTFYIITLFPEIFNSVFSESIIKRAIGKKLINIKFISPRDFATDRHKSVDDKPYGGGKGMVMRVDILVKALESTAPKSHKILLSASGKKYTQQMAKKLSGYSKITLICGHYEGIDARVEKFVDEVISVGDFVLTGGEIAAMVIVDSITRLIPGVINKESLEQESFSQSGNLEYPQYTRPEEFRGLKVLNVLLTGNHQQTEKWRQKEALKRTRKFRPDLLKKLK